MEKTFKLHSHCVSGVAQTCLVLGQPGVMAGLRRALRSTPVRVERREELEALSPEALQYKQDAVSFFSPESRRGATMLRILSKELFNSDWREAGVVVHRCNGCCESVDAAELKIRKWLVKLLKGCRQKLLCRGNWVAWHHALCILGLFMALHRLLPNILRQALSALPLHDQRGGEDANPSDHHRGQDFFCLNNDEKIQQLRVQQAEHRKAAMCWVDGPEPYEALFLLRVSLDEETKLMAKAVKSVSAAWEIQAQAQLLNEGRRPYRLLELATHRH